MLSKDVFDHHLSGKYIFELKETPELKVLRKEGIVWVIKMSLEILDRSKDTQDNPIDPEASYLCLSESNRVFMGKTFICQSELNIRYVP